MSHPVLKKFKWVKYVSYDFNMDNMDIGPF